MINPQHYIPLISAYIEQNRRFLGNEGTEIALSNLKAMSVEDWNAESRLASIRYHVEQARKVKEMMGEE